MWSEVNKKREFCILGTRFFIQSFSEVLTLDYWETLENIYSELYANLEAAR